MKRPSMSMDFRMEHLSMEKDSSSVPTTTPSTNNYLQLTPSTTNIPAQQRSRRSTVSVACERCRKRKTKCSGLPGPCTNCARLNVPCHEPGRRKTGIQSTLEDRIQRLRTLSAAYPSGMPDHQLRMLEGQGLFSHISTEAGPSRTHSLGSAAALYAHGLYDFGEPSPASQNSSEGWAAAGNPATYFDARLEETMEWDMSDYQHEEESNTAAAPITHSEFDTSPVVLGDDQNRAKLYPGGRIAPSTKSNPSRAYQPASPAQRHEPTPIGFTISYDSTFFDESERPPDTSVSTPLTEDHEAGLEEDTSASIHIQSTRHSSIAPKQSTTSSPTLSSRQLHMPFDSNTDSTGLGYQLTRSQTVPTAHTPDIEHEGLRETGLIDLIIRSSDTQKYIGVYFSAVHQKYPFLDPSVFQTRRSLTEMLPNFNYNLIQQQTMMKFQALLVAAIGTLVQHESTSLSSQYVNQANTIRDQFEMWNSVGGIHCAMLLALYCYLAQVMVYDTRQDETAEAQQSQGKRQTRYPVSNLWLHNCQIAAACIDLGMHQPLAMQEQIRSQSDIKAYLETCRSTIRSAYVLDRKISELRNRPRAFHDGDFDPTLLVDL